jgi:ETC complex I subunit conserved region
MPARIFKPARSAMQSGRANTKAWVLEFEPRAPQTAEPLMGWTSSGDTMQQVRLYFDTKEQAVAYAEREGIACEVVADPPTRTGRKSYSDNFRWGRPDNWTH